MYYKGSLAGFRQTRAAYNFGEVTAAEDKDKLQLQDIGPLFLEYFDAV